MVFPPVEKGLEQIDRSIVLKLFLIGDPVRSTRSNLPGDCCFIYCSLIHVKQCCKHTLANWNCLAYNFVASIAFTLKSCWFVSTGPVVSTDVFKALVNIYKEKKTAMPQQLKRKTLSFEMGGVDSFVPMHSLDVPGGVVVFVAMYPFTQVQTYDPGLLAQEEEGPQSPSVFTHSSMSVERCCRQEFQTGRVVRYMPSSTN